MPPIEEEIIEKSASSPIATSCLVIAFLAILGAIAFQILEYGEYRAPLPANRKDAENPAWDTAQADIQAFRRKAKDIIDTNTAGDEGFFGYQETVGSPAGGAGPGSSLLNPPPEATGGALSPTGPTPVPADTPPPPEEPAPEGEGSGNN